MIPLCVTLFVSATIPEVHPLVALLTRLKYALLRGGWHGSPTLPH